MSQIRTLIADDEGPARKYLASLLKNIDVVELVGEARNGQEAVDLINAGNIDLAILDLQMPEVNGMDVLKKLTPGIEPMVVFVTAYDEFAVQAFEVNAVDYLLKPVELARLNETLERVSGRLADENQNRLEKKKLKSAV